MGDFFLFIKSPFFECFGSRRSAFIIVAELGLWDAIRSYPRAAYLFRGHVEKVIELHKDVHWIF
jgi:hypothetical protein